MKLLAVDEINDFEVVASDWCEKNANYLMAAKCCDSTGVIIIETDSGTCCLAVEDLHVCYEKILYLGQGLYQCVTLRDIDTLTDDERAHFMETA